MPRPEHLSFSRADLFERCRRAYAFRYIEDLPSLPAPERDFGKAIHAVCERIVNEHVLGQRVGRLSEERALELFEEEWGIAHLNGSGLFEDGIAILRRFVADEGHLDFQSVLAVEKPFELTLGGYKVVGYIDRIDRTGADTVRVDDYKTYRNPPPRDDVEASLQLSLYELAVRRIYPWAKHVELGLRLLRQGFRMGTRRTPEQLEAAERHFVAIGRAIEAEKTFDASLSTLCSWCDYRASCAAYQDVVTGKRTLPTLPAEDLAEVVQAREDAARTARLATARQRELDGVLKRFLRDQEAVEAAGHRYTMLVTKTRSYPLFATAEKLAGATGLAVPEIVAAIADVDTSRLTAWFKKAALDDEQELLLRAEVDAIARVTYTPRLHERAAGGAQ
jgi:putative RecB family exonuclease